MKDRDFAIICAVAFTLMFTAVAVTCYLWELDKINAFNICTQQGYEPSECSIILR